MTVFVLHHHPENSLGHLDPLLARHAPGVRYLYAPQMEASDYPTLASVTGLVILGGMMSAADTRHHPFLVIEQQFIRQVIEAELPVFGICLGAQLIAASL